MHVVAAEKERQVIRVLVVDDEAVAIRRLRRLLGAIHDIEVVGEATNAQEATVLAAALAPDLLLLDIEMPGRSGIDLASELASTASPPAIVFVTAFGGFALTAFQVAAEHYLLKPVEPWQLEAAIDRVRARLSDQRRAGRAEELEEVVRKLRSAEGCDPSLDAHLWLPDARARARVRLDDVVWIEADRDYVRVHAEGRSYFVRRRIGHLASELEARGFVRVHRSILLRRGAVCRVENVGDRSYRITMSTGATILSSRRFAVAARSLGVAAL